MSDPQPKWRKVLVSGSNAHVAALTASAIADTHGDAESPGVEEKVLVYNTSSGAFYYTGSFGGGTGGGGGTPGGNDQNIQFNNNGAFGGDDGFIFDDAQGASLFVDGPITGSIVSASGAISGSEVAALKLIARNTDDSATIALQDADGNNVAQLARVGSGTQAHKGRLVLRDNSTIVVNIEGHTTSYITNTSNDAKLGINTTTPGKELTVQGSISGSSTGSFADLAGIVDTHEAATNDVLVFNGTSFVAVPSGTSFNFAINSFNYTGPTSNILIGSSSRVVFSAGVLDFTATYNAGPPSDASASIKNDSDSGDPVIFSFGMDSPSYGTGDNPSNITQGDLAVTINERIDFQLTASKDGSTLTSDINQNIYFYNHMKYGASTSTTYNSALISSLGSELLASSYFSGTDRIVTVGSSNYLYLALRTGASQPTQVYCGTGANQLTVAMNSTVTNKTPEVRATIAPYANVNGYSEAFKIYRSQNTNLSAHSSTFEFQSSAQVKNYFFWGRNASTGQETEGGVEGLENKNSTYDDGTITDPTLLTVGVLSNQYVYIAIPSRYGVNGTDYNLKDNGTGLLFDVNSAVDVDITNPVGFQEQYKVYRSINQLDSSGATFTVKIDSV